MNITIDVQLGINRNVSKFGNNTGGGDSRYQKGLDSRKWGKKSTSKLEVSSSLGCQSSQAEATEEAGSLPLTGIRQNGGRCVVEAVHILPWR